MLLSLFELQLEWFFYERFRRIWVERSPYSLIITVFPRNGGSYQMFIKKNIYHGFSQETTIDECLELLNE